MSRNSHSDLGQGDPPPRALAVRVYSPESALRHPLAVIRDLGTNLRAGRGLAWRLFLRDLKAQYRQTYFGYLWAIAPPLVVALTFVFLQSQGILRIQATAVPYAAFAVIGTLLWQTLVDAINAPLAAVAKAKPMLAKINFPREAILLAGLYLVGFNLLIRMVILAGVMAIWGLVPGPGLALFPLAMLGLVAFGTAIGLVLVPLGSLYGDVTRLLPMATQFWMLITPVVYPTPTQGLAAALMPWNPAAPLIATARASITGEGFAHLGPFIGILIASLVLVLLGLIAYRAVIPHLIVRMGG